MADSKHSKSNSNGNRTAFERKTNENQTKIEWESNREKELIQEIMNCEVELNQYKCWYQQAKLECDATRCELDKIRQEYQPLKDYASKLEADCRDYVASTNKKLADIRVINQKLEQENKVLKRKYDEIKDHRPFTADIYKDNDKLKKLLRLKDEQIEELRMQLAQVLSRSGRQPIDQDTINKIIRYKQEGYTYDKIAIYTGVSKSTVSKYLGIYS